MLLFYIMLTSVAKHGYQAGIYIEFLFTIVVASSYWEGEGIEAACRGRVELTRFSTTYITV